MKKSLKKFKLPLDWATNPNLCDGRMQQDTPYNILPSYPNVKPKATLGERAFLFAAPKLTKLWNVLPSYIRESISIENFKALNLGHGLRHLQDKNKFDFFSVDFGQAPLT